MSDYASDLAASMDDGLFRQHVVEMSRPYDAEHDWRTVHIPAVPAGE
jgi:hypothetical protein